MAGGVKIGTAGWTIPKPCAAAFPGEGTHLQRYGKRFVAAEINSSAYRVHRPATYERWAASVPAGFRFAVKLPREITHRRKLVDVAPPLEQFLAEIAGLGDRLGPLLVQLPPSFAYDEAVVGGFFNEVRSRFSGHVVCEPRHASWFTDAVDHALQQARVARAAADPAVVPRAAVPGGWPGLSYRRLHGSPRMYYSAYEPDYLDQLAQSIGHEAGECWCMFDNTASGAAAQDALGLLNRLDLDQPG